MLLMKKKDPTLVKLSKKLEKKKDLTQLLVTKVKKYSTVTKDQVKKAGYSTLRQYLNAGGKKKTSVKKPMKRKSKLPRNRR